MPEVQIDLTITMGETCSNTMTMDEARGLYQALKPIFEDASRTGSPTYSPGVRSMPEPAVYKAPQDTSKGTITEQPTARPAVDTAGSYKQQMPPPNLKVEAARERAAARTRGCGQR